VIERERERERERQRERERERERVAPHPSLFGLRCSSLLDEKTGFYLLGSMERICLDSLST
jgi:hypothetical protein